MSKTLAIMGSGTSLNELPRDYRFTMDTMVLNVAVILPQFYDVVNEQWRKSWTYAVMIDSNLENRKYFPERYAFDVAMANPDGVTYLLKGKFHPPQDSNHRIIEKKVPGGNVLCSALLEARKLGYDRLILFGCDNCRRDDKRYWWETDETVLNHPRNNTLIGAVPDSYEHKDNGKVTIRNRRTPQTWELLIPIIALNGETVYAENTYKRHMERSEAIMEELKGEGVEIFKFTDIGLFDLDCIKDVDELSEVSNA